MTNAAQPEPEIQESILGEADFIVDEVTDEVLRLNLDQFQGPLEVLLYLIKSQEIDIFDIPILKVTEQYLKFLELLEEESLEVTGEFLVMAATLIQIKSKMILPIESDTEEEEEIDEEDPRLELVTKLLEYRQFKEMTDLFSRLEAERAAWFTRNAKPKIESDPDEDEYLEVSLYDLIKAFKSVERYLRDEVIQTVQGEESSVDEKIERISDILGRDGSVSWIQLFKECRGKMELVCCFLAILELCRMGRVKAHQHQTHGDIRLFPAPREAENLAG
jgi:segregation and condensation protein A